MRPIISKAMEYSLYNIKTYKGYKGANLLKISFKEQATMLIIRNFAHSLNIKTTVKINNKLDLICIFDVPEDIYSLK